MNLLNGEEFENYIVIKKLKLRI